MIVSDLVIKGIYMTSRGERVPQSMEIQYSRANIKGDITLYEK